MLTAIKKQFKLEYPELVGVMFFVMLGSTVFGQILMALIYHFDSSVKKHVQVGTIMTLLMLGIYIGIMTLTNIRLQFHIQVSMGCTRTRFFVSYYAVNLAATITGVLLVLGVAYIENLINPILYPDLGNELQMIPYLWKWGIPAAFAITIVAGFCGILVMRFGRMASGFLWVLWMAVCLGLPNLEEAAENTPNSLFGRISGGILNVFMNIPAYMWIVLAAAGCILCLIASYLIIRKLEVKP